MNSNNLTMLYIIISLLVVAADLVTACHAFAEKKNFSQVLGTTCIAAGWVQIIYLLSVFAVDYRAVSALSSLYFVSVSFLLLVLLTFVRANAIRKPTRINNIFKHGLALGFIVDTVLFLINPFKEIMVHYAYVGGIVAKYGYIQKPLYLFHLLLIILMVAIIMYHLVNRMITVPDVYKRQYLSTVIVVLAVFGLHILFLSYPRLFGRDALDYSLWGYSIAAFSLYLNFFRYPVKGMKAYYHEWIVENINQGVILFNHERKLIIHNDKVHTIFGEENIKEGMSIDEFIDFLDLDIKEGRFKENFSLQHYIKKDDKEIPIRFDHRCLKNKKGANMGELFVFTDEAGDTDLLTSFYNWENFKQLLQETPENFVTDIVIGVADINGLGEINSRLGKNAGDQAIVILANTLRKHFTGASYYVRGQEASLIVLCFDMTPDEVKVKLKLVQEEMASTDDFDYPLNIQSAISVVTENNSDVLAAIKQAFMSMKNKKLLDAKSRKSELVTSLVKTLAECDNDTEAHVRRTQTMGEALGNRLGLTDVQQSDLALLCILHDIGKIGIPLDILNKPGKLTDAQWRMMRTHTEKGYQIATSSQELSHIADAILHHHESWDGKGYPDGLSKESIPLLSRIIAVVDSYDAMVNDRVYRPKMSTQDAIKELKRCAGTQFDPGVVNEFVKMLPEIEGIEIDENLDIMKNSEEPVSNVSQATETTTSTSNVHKVSFSRYILDGNMRIVQADETFETITGYSLEDIKKNDIKQVDLLPEEDRIEYLKMVNEQIGQKNLAYFEHRIKRKDGSIIFVFCYGKVYYDSAEKAERSEILVFESANTYAMRLMISEEQSKAELRLAKWEDKYRCDSLTGLLNHEAFKNDVEMKLLESNSKIMLLMMDVDKFKQYNDTYGHRAGDEFLIMLAQTLAQTLRKDDLACRMGGDEFAAALFYNDSVADSVMLERAQQICDKINLILTNTKGGTSLSMGVVISDEENNLFNVMYENADQALYKAKETGRAKMMVYGDDK